MAESIDSVQMHTLPGKVEICDRCVQDFADWHMTVAHISDGEKVHTYTVCNACVIEYFMMIEVQKLADIRKRDVDERSN